MSYHRCSTCKESKTSSEFHKDSSRNSGVQRYCKSCKKEFDRKGSNENHLGKYVVYYLPKENYIGMTFNYKKRIGRHKRVDKNTSKSRVIFATKNARLAHLIETLFHLIGFKGFRY